ncbi:MAG: AAA family ATPase [bacterium]|nr:AAA family ATPase [bacterium]
MYITDLRIQNVKRLRDFQLSFGSDDEPRLWTVLIGANGLCKTAILQCIALAASGHVRGNQLVDAASLPDLRRQETARVDANFTFGERGHSQRFYPGLSESEDRSRPRVGSSIFVAPGDTDLQGFASYYDEAAPLPAESRPAGNVTAAELEKAGYIDELAKVFDSEATAHSVLDAIEFPRQRRPVFTSSSSLVFWHQVVVEIERGLIAEGLERLLAAATRFYPHNPIFNRWAITDLKTGNGFNPLEVARAKNVADWLVAGYGTSRLLPRPLEGQRPKNPSEERLATLFDQGKITGTEFVRILGDAEDFTTALHRALIESELLPEATGIKMHSRHWARSAKDVVKGDQVQLRLGVEEVDVPATWLSQGYQSTIAWIADIVGWFYFERKEPIPVDEMEGLVLIDEIDLHLHPAWQEKLIPILKKVFPRLQFVVTTHSSMVLTGLKPEEIVILKQDKAGNVVPAQLDEAPPALLTGSQIYDRYFGVRRVQAARLGAALRRHGVLSSVESSVLGEDERRELESLRRQLTAAGVDLGDRSTKAGRIR